MARPDRIIGPDHTGLVALCAVSRRRAHLTRGVPGAKFCHVPVGCHRGSGTDGGPRMRREYLIIQGLTPVRTVSVYRFRPVAACLG